MSCEKPEAIPHNPAAPLDPGVKSYVSIGGQLRPHTYTGWRDETMAWKDGAYLGTSLNPAPTFRIKGPDAAAFLKKYLVNGFDKFPVGYGKHGIMCREDGTIMIDGIIIRTGEDEFYTYYLSPYIDYCFQKERLNAVGENLSGQRFLFQVAGPRSLEILEAASGDDLHDIKFMHHRMSRIDGKEVRVLRVGMAGSLAYEVHGVIEDSHDVYRAVRKAGESRNLRRLGQLSYMMNHTEDGFPQAYYHFNYPWAEDEGFVKYLTGGKGDSTRLAAKLAGSVGNDVGSRYRNPVELGWSGSVKFDHDFIGRKALEALAAAPKRKTVTLVWNKEDVIDVYASRFEQGEQYQDMDAPNDSDYTAPMLVYRADKVFTKEGRCVGVSSGRAYSQYYREMLSLCTLDIDSAGMGNELLLLWGDDGKRQKEIRVTVSRFPYLDEGRNNVFDVSAIPRVGKK